MPSPFRLIFVCMGNICRSPAAEGVMESLVQEAGLSDQIEIDSAGTGGWHAGERADRRMRSAAASRGYQLESRARQVTSEDLAQRDLVILMDQQNVHDLRPFDPAGKHQHRVALLTDFCTQHEATEVPDPYYGGPDGFEQVLDLLEDGCSGLLEDIRKKLRRNL